MDLLKNELKAQLSRMFLGQVMGAPSYRGTLPLGAFIFRIYLAFLAVMLLVTNGLALAASYHWLLHSWEMSVHQSLAILAAISISVSLVLALVGYLVVRRVKVKSESADLASVIADKVPQLIKSTSDIAEEFMDGLRTAQHHSH